MKGYTERSNELLQLAGRIAEFLRMGPFTKMFQIKCQESPLPLIMPVVSFSILAEYNGIEAAAALCAELERRGWLIPCASVDSEEGHVMRVVVQHGCTNLMCDDFLSDLSASIEREIGGMIPV